MTAVTGPTATGRGLQRRWTAATTAGELVGFCAPAVAGAVTYRAGAGVTYTAMLTAGAVEGLCLGWAQAWALAPVLPTLSRRRFTFATGAAAVAAYAIGMAPSTFHDRLAGTSPVLLWPLGFAGVVTLLGSIGTAQWLVLRGAGCRALWWVFTTAGGWLAGLAAFLLVATPLWQPGQPVALIAVIGVFAGLVMAVTVAVVTGFAARRLRPGPHDRPADRVGPEERVHLTN
jgi:hypothetical protein